MEDIFLEGISVICKVRMSKKARRLSLRIQHDGTVEAVVPTFISQRQAESFIRSKEDWIIEALKDYQKREEAYTPIRIQDQAVIPCFNEQYRISIQIDTHLSRVLLKEEGELLSIRGSRMPAIRKKVIEWYKRKAKDYFVGQSLLFAQRINVSVYHVRIRDMETRWGSAAVNRKSLTYNWRLALAPEMIARYVVAHEVAHLRYADHSQQFWGLVEELYPEYKQYRKWLKKFGFALQLS